MAKKEWLKKENARIHANTIKLIKEEAVKRREWKKLNVKDAKKE